MPQDPSAPNPHRRLGTWTAMLLVVANMIGSGVFATTGLLLPDVGSPATVLLAWLVGGLLALCGALAYGELAAALPRNGGEYRLLTRIYHPAAGFVAGWISLVVGFSAPIAFAALAFGAYLHAIEPAVPAVPAGVGLVAVLSALHAIHVTAGGAVQNLFVLAKVLFVAVFAIGGAALGDPGRALPAGGGSLVEGVGAPAFAVALVIISYSYSGWNGAAYVAGEVRRPSRALPRALAGGAAIVTVLYVALNAAFLAAAPANELSGVVEIGHVAAIRLFGGGAAVVLSAGIALCLVSSVSAMIMAGPRVYHAMGEDYRPLRFLTYRTAAGGPAAAVVLQGTAAIALVLTASFGALLTYLGFTLSLCAGFTVAGVFVLRRREPSLPRPYRTWGYPATPALFVALSSWMVVHSLIERPWIALAGLGTVASGLAAYAVLARHRTTAATSAS
ncbi:MAG: amino acid permease [Myxococcota bacterium]|nr:amino acid permease [Myxococcota bacterium]